ncbi:MAG: UDP-N-acetylmuramoyl-L-alanine--D-glutamate ligase [Oligoflexia bacterium]|nr:UDP-N-acetylmuramoyl-L-alanine--D-glutamate ligase [Oligoflexia bacterium]
MNNPIDFLKKPIAIVGMGVSGEACKRLLEQNGLSSIDLVTFDEKEGKADFHDPETMLEQKNPKTLVVSPGYPLSKEWIQDFRDQGVEVTSELALAILFLEKEKIIGITGSVGKSTVTSLLGTALLDFDSHGFFGGNLGVPLATYMLEVQSGKRKRAQWIVLELSSYQLENPGVLSLEYSVITYLTPNHLERYDSLEQYYETKFTIAARTKKAMIVNEEGGDLKKFLQGRKVDCQVLWTSQSDDEISQFHFEQAKLLGSHNQDNLAVAAKVAREAGWPFSSIEKMKMYPGLPHRMENLGTFYGVTLINDSKATTIESVVTAALGLYEQMDKKAQLFLLLGGKDKNLPWQDLEVLKKIQKIRPVYFGQSKDLAAKGLGIDGPKFSTLKEAIIPLSELAQKGDYILLSPGGTSLDEFSSFEERGNFFRKEAIRLFSGG